MFNLLLPKDKAAVYREYVVRLWILIFSGALFVLVVGIVFLLPSYLWLRGSEKNAMDERAALPATPADADLSKTLSDAEDAVGTLHTSGQLLYQEMIGRLVAARGPGIRLNDIDYSLDGGALTLRISGISADRESLVAFSKALEADPLYGRVDVPISNFVKDRNIEFTLSIQGK